MYPYGCKATCSLEVSTGYVSVLTLAGAAIKSNFKVYDSRSYNNYIELPNLAAGDYMIKVEMTKWDTNAVHDYTVRVYGAGVSSTTVLTPHTVDVAAVNDAALTTAVTNGIGACSPKWISTKTLFVLQYGFQTD